MYSFTSYSPFADLLVELLDSTVALLYCQWAHGVIAVASLFFLGDCRIIWRHSWVSWDPGRVQWTLFIWWMSVVSFFSSDIHCVVSWTSFIWHKCIRSHAGSAYQWPVERWLHSSYMSPWLNPPILPPPVQGQRNVLDTMMALWIMKPFLNRLWTTYHHISF
jgi:hypothetical protein